MFEGGYVGMCLLHLSTKMHVSVIMSTQTSFYNSYVFVDYLMGLSKAVSKNVSAITFNKYISGFLSFFSGHRISYAKYVPSTNTLPS